MNQYLVVGKRWGFCHQILNSVTLKSVCDSFFSLRVTDESEMVGVEWVMEDGLGSFRL